jgi:hypothetical protein
LDARPEVEVFMSMRSVGGILMALVAAAMFLFVEDVVVAVPITLLIVGIALIADDARARRG